MAKGYSFIDYTKEDKLLRLAIREKAEETLIRYAKKGISDIFDIVENEAVLFVRPEEIVKMSGATLFNDGMLLMFINSAYTLGHQRFTAAHELGHIVLHLEKIKEVHLLKKDETLEREADLFATEFLMPVNGVTEMFYKLVDVEPLDVTLDDIIIMHNYFKVSFKAMLKRLVYLGLCAVENYGELEEWCSLDKAESLRKKTEQLGYSCDLISKNKRYYINKEYEFILMKNYKKGVISFAKYAETLDYMGKSPLKKGDWDASNN
ncbi:MAG: peptidase [Firmicutes bacterium HGW-Firmicutes-1]|jgi:Zn-dependent peptidase ImmA (M78 family)|nr:MAG: peptidase [Firmicutes bacterium HGW-Firmicutes-1]